MSATATMPFRRVEFSDPCSCAHFVHDHLIYLGPFKLCMETGCTCGLRSLARFTLSSAPWLLYLAVGGFLAFHLAKWAALGFRVVSQ